MAEFEFRQPGALQQGGLSLQLHATFPADPTRDYVPYYHFKIMVEGQHAGNLRFRPQITERLKQLGGNIGYDIDEGFRGQRYAEKACRLLLPFAVDEHKLSEIWLTCKPDNWPSRRTCEKLGAQLVNIIAVPPTHDMYNGQAQSEAENQRCRYRLCVS